MFLGFGAGDFNRDPASHGIANTTEAEFGSVPDVTNPVGDPFVELARCFLRLANLPNFVFDRLSRYEATIWRQVAQVLFALDNLDRRKPLERRRLPFKLAPLGRSFTSYEHAHSWRDGDFRRDE